MLLSGQGGVIWTGFDEEWLVPILGQINNEYFYVLLCVNLKGAVGYGASDV